MLIWHGNWSLILSKHRRQTSRLGTFKCKLSLVFKTSCIGLKFTCVEVNWLFLVNVKRNKIHICNLYLFYICMTIVPFQRDITKNKKLHTHTVYWRAELSLRGCSFPESLGKKVRTSKLLFGNNHLKKWGGNIIDYFLLFLLLPFSERWQTEVTLWVYIFPVLKYGSRINWLTITQIVCLFDS